MFRGAPRASYSQLGVWLSLPVSTAAAPAGKATVFDRRGMLRPIFPGRTEKDPRAVLIDTQEGRCLSKDTLMAQGTQEV